MPFHTISFLTKKGSSRAAPKAGQCKVVENELLQLILLLILVMQKIDIFQLIL